MKDCEIEYIKCSCCGELIDIDYLEEDGLCYECYCNMFHEEF